MTSLTSCFSNKDKNPFPKNTIENAVYDRDALYQESVSHIHDYPVKSVAMMTEDAEAFGQSAEENNLKDAQLIEALSLIDSGKLGVLDESEILQFDKVQLQFILDATKAKNTQKASIQTLHELDSASHENHMMVNFVTFEEDGTLTDKTIIYGRKNDQKGGYSLDNVERMAIGRGPGRTSFEDKSEISSKMQELLISKSNTPKSKYGM